MSRGRIEEEEEVFNWSSLPEEKRPQFFKIMHNSIIQDGCLGIPVKFVKKIEKDLGDDFATLKVPTGEVWRVEMIKKFNIINGGDNGVWFRNGLQEFIESHSISSGQFLVFRYDGNSQFYVLIFDMSGSEIDYHLCNNISNSNDLRNSEQSNPVNNDEQESFETEIEDIQEDYMETWDKDESSSDEDEEDEDIARMNAKMKGSLRKSRSLATRENVARGNQIAEEFKSKFPFFTVTLQPAYVNHKYMPIPFPIHRTYFPENLERIRIKALDGRSWMVGLLCSEKKEIRLSKGLSDFMYGNNLVEGDVCVFEIVKKRYLVLKVHIFRRNNC